MFRVAIAVVATALCAAVPSAQQPTPQEPATMIATGDYLFVMRGREIFQFDVDTLQLRHRVELPAPAIEGTPIPPVVEKTREQEQPPMAERIGVLLDAEDRARGQSETPMPEQADVRDAELEPVANAIDAALQWLAEHQDADGRWDSDAFMEHDPAGDRTDGQGRAVHDVGVTGLAVLAFLGNSSLREGPHRETLRRAVGWLIDQQDPQGGMIGTNAHNTFIYDHAIATLALVEAYGLSDYRVLEGPAQKAIDYLEWHRNPYSVWRYQPRDGDNDTSVTTWCVMAYASARDFGLNINPSALKLAESWIDEMTDPVSGRTGYTERGGMSSRLVGEHAERYPRDANEAMTAAALTCRFLLGHKPEEDRLMIAQADLILTKPPRWEPGTIDEYAWLLGTHALWYMGGRWWQSWMEHLDDAVIATQRTDGAFAGSWDPLGVWGQEGGRVFTTAMLTWTLEIQHQWLRINR